MSLSNRKFNRNSNPISYFRYISVRIEHFWRCLPMYGHNKLETSSLRIPISRSIWISNRLKAIDFQLNCKNSWVIAEWEPVLLFTFQWILLWINKISVQLACRWFKLELEDICYIPFISSVSCRLSKNIFGDSLRHIVWFKNTRKNCIA